MLKLRRTKSVGYAFVYQNKNDFHKLKNEIEHIIPNLSPNVFFDDPKTHYNFWFRYSQQNGAYIITIRFKSSAGNKKKLKLKLDKPGIILLVIQPPEYTNEHNIITLQYANHLYDWTIENSTYISLCDEI